MLRANPPEVTTIRGDEGAKFQTFRNGHNGSIYESEKLVGAKKLGRALQVSQSQVLHGDLSGGQGLGKLRLHRRAQPFPNEISCLGDHRDGDQQRLALLLQEIAHWDMPRVVGVGERVDSPGVEQQRHDYLRRRAARWAPGECGASSRQSKSSARSEVSR